MVDNPILSDFFTKNHHWANPVLCSLDSRSIGSYSALVALFKLFLFSQHLACHLYPSASGSLTLCPIQRAASTVSLMPDLQHS
jgi:hypothetical protein